MKVMYLYVSTLVLKFNSVKTKKTKYQCIKVNMKSDHKDFPILSYKVGNAFDIDKHFLRKFNNENLWDLNTSSFREKESNKQKK